jgi:hypothetical protein
MAASKNTYRVAGPLMTNETVPHFSLMSVILWSIKRPNNILPQYKDPFNL